MRVFRLITPGVAAFLVVVAFLVVLVFADEMGSDTSGVVSAENTPADGTDTSSTVEDWSMACDFSDEPWTLSNLPYDLRWKYVDECPLPEPPPGYYWDENIHLEVVGVWSGV